MFRRQTHRRRTPRRACRVATGRPAKAVGADSGARFLKTHPVTIPVVDPISHGWCFDHPVCLKDLAYTLAGDMDREVIPTRTNRPHLSLAAQ